MPATKPKPQQSATATAKRKRRLATRKVLRGATADSVRAAADRLIASGEGRTVAHRLIKDYREKFYPSMPSTHAAERIENDMRRLSILGASAKRDDMAEIVDILSRAEAKSRLDARTIQTVLRNPQI